MSMESSISSQRIPKNPFGDIKIKPEPSKLKMRILLVAKATIPFERNAIMLLSSNLKKQGCEVKAGMLKCSTTKADDKKVTESQERIYNMVKDFKPHVIGYSCMTGEHYDILKINTRLKKDFEFISVMGGPHATFNRSIIEEDDLDAICTGEGDNSFPEFINRIQNEEEWWLTPTFHTKHKGQIYRNPLADLVPDLNDLPFPDRQVLYDADPDLAKIGNKSFISARGCPYKCTYCFNKQYNDNYKGKGQILRVRSPQLVVDEIERVKNKYPLDTVTFTDDIFTLRPSGWIVEFSDLYKKRIGLPFNITARASSVKKEDIKTLKNAGLAYVWMGVECGDEEYANSIFLRHTTNETIIKVAKWFKEYDVGLLSLNILGLPVKNPFEVDLRTLDLNLKLKPALGFFSLLYPFPGTAIAKTAIERGYFKEDKNTLYLESNWRNSMLKFNSKKEKMMVENLHKLAGIIIEFPFLRPFTKFLCSLPLSNFYRLLMFIHLGYAHKIRLRPPKFKTFLNELPIFWGYFKALLAKT